MDRVRFLTNEHGQPECEHNMEDKGLMWWIISSLAPGWRDLDCESHFAKEVTLPVPGQDRESVPEPAEVMNEGNIGAKADGGDSSPEILFSEEPETAQDRGTRWCFFVSPSDNFAILLHLSNTIWSLRGTDFWNF